jgi:hypothetical protein
VPEASSAPRPKPVVLLILDGWGHRDDPADNALAQAELPNWRRLWSGSPHTLIHTEGRHVGLPDGQMGNSEVGHMNLGAGRIVYQDLTRIDAAIEDGSFFDNPELRGACEAVGASGGTLQVMGLLSPGGVHSHERQMFAMLELAHRAGVPKVAVHAFLDGRDTPPRSAAASLVALQARCDALGNARIASISGRYYAMDRDQRWDRVHRDAGHLHPRRQFHHREQVALVAVHAAGRQQAHQVQGAAVVEHRGAGAAQRRVLEEAAVLDRGVDAAEVLVDDAAGAEVHVAHLGIAHLPLGQADVAALGVDQRVRAVRPQAAPVGQFGLGERIVGGVVAVAPAIQDQQDHRARGVLGGVRRGWAGQGGNPVVRPADCSDTPLNRSPRRRIATMTSQRTGPLP